MNVNRFKIKYDPMFEFGERLLYYTWIKTWLSYKINTHSADKGKAISNKGYVLRAMFCRRK